MNDPIRSVFVKLLEAKTATAKLSTSVFSHRPAGDFLRVVARSVVMA